MQDKDIDITSSENVHISEHAYMRMRERNGWNKKTAKRMINKIYARGLRLDEVKGYKKKWMCHRMINALKDDEYVIYGDYVYIFREHVLKTTFPLPCREQVMRHIKN